MLSSPIPLHGKRIAGRVVAAAIVASVLLFGGAAASGRAQAQAPPAAASGLPTITFRRVFQGSVPEFVEIVVRQDGAAKADVRQLSDTAEPQEFIVGPEFRDQIFDLARQLKNFKGADLDSHRRVANLGQKTFRWEQGAETYQAQFNYTLDPKAAQLQKMFENLAVEQADLGTLEERLRYDRLGVSQALARFEDHLDQRALPQPERFLPLLDRIGDDTRVMEVARQRARSLAARIRVVQGQ
jgi:hypothetical protein